MANPSALCKSENFDSIDQVETTSDTLTGRAGLTFQITWDRSVADAVLRGGSRSSNDGDTAIEAIRHLTRKIRKALGEEIPIVVRMDTGFCDKKIYQACEDLGIGCVGIGYLSGGRLQEAIKDEAEKRPGSDWVLYSSDGVLYQNGSQEWAYHERDVEPGAVSDGRSTRALIHTHLRCEDGQRRFDFARKDTVIYTNVIYTNLGLGGPVDRRLDKAGKESFLETQSLVELHHGRG